jgi:hypothetical protein
MLLEKSISLDDELQMQSLNGEDSAIYKSNVTQLSDYFEDCDKIFNTVRIMKTAADKYL